MDSNEKEFRTVIVHGPPASGKTFHGDDLARALGCNTVVDDGPLRRGYALQKGALHLTDCRPAPGVVPDSVLILPIETALAVAFVVGAI